MTTATTNVVKEDTTTPADPLDMGAGRIDVGRAIAAPVVIDETPANFAALGNDPVNAVHLNIPSINAPVMPGKLVTTRTVKNVSKRPELVRPSGIASPGTKITVSPKSKLVAPGKSATFTITIESVAPVGTQQFGTVRIRTNGTELHLPVAFIHTQGEVSLTQSCDPMTVEMVKPGVNQTECTVQAANDSFADQDVTLDSTVPVNMEVVPGSVDGATQVGPKRVHASTTLSGASPGVPAVVDGSDGFGYVPLEDFGTVPIAVGDEEIVNFNITGGGYEFAGQTWDSIGVDSNGYLIVGGGSSEDNNCCNLPAGPDPARPNNILAPFWTDLDGTGAPGILVDILGLPTGEEWLIVEYQVNVWGTSDLRTFQVWIGLNGVEDIDYEYAANQTDPDGQDFLVGAENLLGDGEMGTILPTTDGLRIESSDATPGDVVSYSFRARGTRVGSGEMITEMRASEVPGVTLARTLLRVVRKLP